MMAEKTRKKVPANKKIVRRKARTPKKNTKAISSWASLHPGVGMPVPNEFAAAIDDLANNVGMPVWFVIQGGPGTNGYDFLGSEVHTAFLRARNRGLIRGQKIALVIDSRGGDARSAYQLSLLLRKHCGGFVAVVPRRAKSAATLLSLGADQILLGEHGELGPLDVQLFEPERETPISGLDEVQSLERLYASAMTAFDQAMWLFKLRTGMKVTTLLPHAIKFVTAMVGPMFANIDVVRYSQMSRLLRVADLYAQRLLMPRLGTAKAKAAAARLVEDYPEHGFVIDCDEARRLGLMPQEPTADQIRILDAVAGSVSGLTAIGQLERTTSP